jgi:protein-disulfide isomerase
MSLRVCCLSGVRAATLLFAAGSCLQAQGIGCTQPLSPERQRTFLDYVRKRYKLPDSIALELSKQSPVKDTCYRELTFRGTSQVRTWDLTLYLSPDSRFLSTDMLDTSVDPAAEQRAKDAALLNGLAPGTPAVRGPDKSPVTLAVFSDFQCPYCRRFAQYLDEILADGTEDVRVVFHHMPLGMHSWARTAAIGAACAQQQNSAAFWALHDQIFGNQESVTSANLKHKLGEFAKSVKGLDTKAFQRCVDGGMSLGLVLQDINLAAAAHVEGTPTVFVNGNRAPGVGSAAELRELISRARKEAAGRGSSMEP